MGAQYTRFEKGKGEDGYVRGHTREGMCVCVGGGGGLQG